MSKTATVFSLLFCLLLYTGAARAQPSACISNTDTGLQLSYTQLTSLFRTPQPQYFFYGETHTRFFEPLFKYQYIVFLNKTCGVRDIFIETGYSAAFLFDQYVSTGDTVLINMDILYTAGNYRRMWHQLYAYNQTLAADKRLRIHGVDFEANPSYFKTLLLLADPHTLSPELTPMWDSLRLYADKSSLRYPAPFAPKRQYIQRQLDTHPQQIAQLFKNTIRLYQKITGNTLLPFSPNRDSIIYYKMRHEMEEYGIGSFVAFFGGDHINYNSPVSIPNIFHGDTA